MSDTATEASARSETRLRSLLLPFAAGVALGAAVSFWLAGVLALHFGVEARYELVAAGDACFRLDRRTGAVERTEAEGYELVVAGERTYRLNRSTGEVEVLAASGWTRVAADSPTTE